MTEDRNKIDEFSQPADKHAKIRMIAVVSLLIISIMAGIFVIYRSYRKTGTKTTVMYTTEGGVVMVERYIEYGRSRP